MSKLGLLYDCGFVWKWYQMSYQLEIEVLNMLILSNLNFNVMKSCLKLVRLKLGFMSKNWGF